MTFAHHEHVRKMHHLPSDKRDTRAVRYDTYHERRLEWKYDGCVPSKDRRVNDTLVQHVALDRRMVSVD